MHQLNWTGMVSQYQYVATVQNLKGNFDRYPRFVKNSAFGIATRDKSFPVIAFAFAVCRIQQSSDRFAMEQRPHMKTYGNSSKYRTPIPADLCVIPVTELAALIQSSPEGLS